MMAKPGSMDYWRRFFRGTNSDIFEVIEQAIAVAAVDCPKEFRTRRDRIAEKLFTCRISRCSGCNNVELKVPDCGEDLVEVEGGASVKREVAEKGSKVDSSNGEHLHLNRVGLSNSYNEAEALTDVMEEESQIVGEVLRLKDIFHNSDAESDATIFDALRRLQLLEISVEILKETQVGKAVNVLRKHDFKPIRQLVRTLIEGWKVLVDEWVSSAAAFSNPSSDSVNPALVEEEGLPSPPMDETALFATQPTSMELSKFFDGIDDDGNFKASGPDTEKPIPASRGPVRKPEPPRQSAIVRLAKPDAAPNAQPKPRSIVIKVGKSSLTTSAPSRPANLALEQKPSSHLPGVQRKPSNIPQDKLKNSEEAAARAKLELTKRKLHDGYQRAENVKRQRTVQIVEIRDLPKPESPKTKKKAPIRSRAGSSRHTAGSFEGPFGAKRI